jgi:hypothetical protein
MSSVRHPVSTDLIPSKHPFRHLSGHIWLLGALLLVAFLLREGLVHYGLPLLLYEDEPIYYDHALGFGLGHWHIAYFKKPGFFLYFYAFFYYLGFLAAPVMEWRDYVTQFWQDPAYVATIGRTVSVAIATGSLWLLAKIGKKAFSVPVGLAAAFLLAFDPTHLRISPIVISDIPALFFVLAAAWFALQIAERGRLRDYLLCASMVALAISFKYNAFCGVFLLAGHLTHHTGSGEKPTVWLKSALCNPKFWWAVALVPTLFLLLNPLVLMDFQTFREDLNVERRHMLSRNATLEPGWHFMPAFDDIFFRILPKALSWPIYLLGLPGMIWMFMKHRRQALVLLSFPLVFLLVVLQFKLINAKYLLPLFPFWYLAASLFVLSGVTFCQKRWFPQTSGSAGLLAFSLLMILLALPSFSTSSQYIRIQRQPDTRNLAFNACQGLVRPRDRFLLEPDTLTMNNRLYRSRMVVADYQATSFATESHEIGEMDRLNLSDIHPRYVLMDLGRAEKSKDAQGQIRYLTPYAPDYYQRLQTEYRLKQIFSPYQIRLSLSAMQQSLSTEGFGGLYARIQNNKSKRRTPGPLLLLLEQKTETP